MMLPLATIFRATIGENAEQRHLLRIEEWHHPVIQHVGRYQRIFPVIELRHHHLRVRVDEGLLIDTAHRRNGNNSATSATCMNWCGESAKTVRKIAPQRC